MKLNQGAARSKQLCSRQASALAYNVARSLSIRHINDCYIDRLRFIEMTAGAVGGEMKSGQVTTGNVIWQPP